MRLLKIIFIYSLLIIYSLEILLFFSIPKEQKSMVKIKQERVRIAKSKNLDFFVIYQNRENKAVKFVKKYLINNRKKFGIDKIKPGITGYAQINGRDLISDEKKLKLEIEYIKKQGFYIDLMIILKTLEVVFNKNCFKAGKDLVNKNYFKAGKDLGHFIRVFSYERSRK